MRVGGRAGAVAQYRKGTVQVSCSSTLQPPCRKGSSPGTRMVTKRAMLSLHQPPCSPHSGPPGPFALLRPLRTCMSPRLSTASSPRTTSVGQGMWRQQWSDTLPSPMNDMRDLYGGQGG